MTLKKETIFNYSLLMLNMKGNIFYYTWLESGNVDKVNILRCRYDNFRDFFFRLTLKNHSFVYLL